MKSFSLSILLFAVFVSASHADIVDLFFLAGQSNAGNFGELNSYDPQGYRGLNQNDANRSASGFNLHFGRIFDRPSTNSNTGLNDVFHSFSETQLDDSLFAVDRLATNLNRQLGNDVGIYSYGRNGTTLFHSPTDNRDSWFPGTDPAGGQLFDNELYGSFQSWAGARISALESAGHTVNVRGIFWFQGESDVGLGSIATADYEENFANLVERFRIDFGNDLAVIASGIREIQGSANFALQQQVNQALANVALTDNLVQFVSSRDLTPVSANDVHLETDGYFDLAERWSSAFQQTAIPEPGTGLVLLMMAVPQMLRRRRSS